MKSDQIRIGSYLIFSTVLASKFFTQHPTKIFCINVFDVGGCLASCLTFRPFLMLDP